MKHDMVIGHYSSSGYVGEKASFLKNPTIKFEYSEEEDPVNKPEHYQYSPWNAGCCIFIFNYSRFNANTMLSVLERCGVTTLCAPPTVWRMLIQEDLAAYRSRLKIRVLVGAGEPLNPEIIDQIKNAWGLTLRDGFGQTETTAVIGNSPDQRLKPGSMGRPLPGYEVVLLDADGNEAVEGEVCLKMNPRPLGLMVG